MSKFAAVEGAGHHKVLVLHGWALDSSVWLSARALSNQKDLTYAYFDFPGYGVNRDEEPAVGIDGMAAAALNAVDELGWTSYSVLGHSMGGTTALRIATLRPQQVLSIAAITPVSPAGTLLDDASYSTFEGAWADPGKAIQSALAPNIETGDLSRLVDRNRATMSQQAWIAYLANWTGADFLEELHSVKVPTTLFYGESDPFVTREYLGPTMTTLSNGHIEKLSGGHYPMIESTASSVPLWESALMRS